MHGFSFLPFLSFSFLLLGLSVVARGLLGCNSFSWSQASAEYGSLCVYVCVTPCLHGFPVGGLLLLSSFGMGPGILLLTCSNKARQQDGIVESSWPLHRTCHVSRSVFEVRSNRLMQ